MKQRCDRFFAEGINSTLLTLFIIPALYSVFVNRSQRKEKEKLARLAAEHQASRH